MSAAAVFEDRADPRAVASAALSAVVHLILLAVLILGVSWQNRTPEAVEVELWLPPPPAPAVEAPKPEPAPTMEVAPPKPEPVIPKPEIVEQKAPPPRPVAKVEPKPVPKVEPRPEPKKAEPKPVPKAEPFKPRPDFREELMREQVDQERQRILDQIGRDAASQTNRSRTDWMSRIQAKVLGNVVLPKDLQDNAQANPEAVFTVVLLPTGEILSHKLIKPSGHPAYDLSVERAILKSSPLPKPDKPENFERELRLNFRPQR